MTNERGQVTVLVVGMAMVVFAVAGLAVDGTRAFLFRRTLQSAADAAALAGAGELDAQRYYSTRGRAIRLDPGAARRVAARYIETRGLRVDSDVGVRDDRVAVTLRGSVEPLFLRLVGVRRIPVAAEADSSPVPQP